MGKDDPLYRPLPDSYQIPPEPAGPPPAARRSWWATGGATIASAFTLWGLLYVVPHFDRLYADVQVRYEASTAFLVRLSRVAVEWIPLTLALGLLYPWWLGRPASTFRGRAIRSVSGWAFLAFWFWSAYALFEPLLAVAGPLRKC